ncbi:hypothetical protein B0H16DRAFT_1749820 [Mycena metata]|uniref:Uncharacterized protein n=1 Tax=Mycena metata TaxID=1033252 RepID=A0AAD7DTV8_9AGAR|nr:hypothetical protein B0H16DRAFT_1749820 [Mycena metata]
MEVNDASFKKSDWIGQGKKWAATLPSVVRRAAQAELSIPQELEYELLPAPVLPITQLIQYPLPLQIATVSNCKVSAFFSKTLPGHITSTAVLGLRHLPIPDTKLVNRLYTAVRQVWLDGYKSVQYTHLNGTVTSYFPLWLVNYWKQVVELRSKVRQPWMKAQEWVERQKKTHNRTLAETTSTLLTKMPWGLTKPSDSEPYHSLWRFLGPHWLAGSQLNDALELLRLKINSTPGLTRDLRVKSIDMTRALLKAYDERDTINYTTVISQQLGQARNLRFLLIQCH